MQSISCVEGREPCRAEEFAGPRPPKTISPEEILKATRELLALMIRQNGIQPEDVASAIFSTTTDLDAEFPALAARQLGWFDVALMCVHELDVPGSLRRCIRILLHWNTDKPADEIVHVYVKEAAEAAPRPLEPPAGRLEGTGAVDRRAQQRSRQNRYRK